MSAIQTVARKINGSKIFRALATIATLIGGGAVIIGIYTYVSESNERAKQRSYEAWQVIDTANASKQTGDGGRRDAINDLIGDERNMSNIALDTQHLDAVAFEGADLTGAIFDDSSIGNSHFECRQPTYLSLSFLFGQCKQTTLTRAHFGTDTPNDTNLISMEKNHFDGANLNYSLFRHIDHFVANSFDKSYLNDAYFANITFGGRNTFKNAHLERLHFRDVKFGGPSENNDISADFSGAFLNDATFDGQDISPVQLPTGYTRLCKTTFNSEVNYRDCPELNPPQDRQSKIRKMTG